MQTGDVLDRGNASGKILEQLFRLQDEAPKSGRAPGGGMFGMFWVGVVLVSWFTY